MWRVNSSMSLIQKWNNFCAQKYIRKFQKYLPYLNLKEEVSKQMSLENQFKLVDEILGEYRENFIEEVLQKDVRFTEYIIERYLKQNPNYEYHLTQDCLLENSCNYFEDEGVREEVIQYILSNNQLLKRILFSETCDREFLIKEVLLEKSDIAEIIATRFSTLNPQWRYAIAQASLLEDIKVYFNKPEIKEKFIQELRNDEELLIGGLSKCIYNPDKQVLTVEGWYLPKCNYDTIYIYLNGELLESPATGIKRIDVYRDYATFNEKYSGFKLVTEYKKYVTENDIIEVCIERNQKQIKKSQKKIVFSKNNLGNKINADVASESKVEIYHDNVMIDDINLNELNNVKNLFATLDRAIRVKKESGWKVRGVSNHRIKKEVALRELSQSPEVFEGYQELIEGAEDNVDFYRNYLSTPNFLRVYEDYKFIEPYISCDMRILNIGAVPPILESMILRGGKFGSLTVLDPNAKHYENYFKQHKINYINSDIFSIANEDIAENYDLVIFAEVLEHLSGDLPEILLKLNKYVSTNGYLFITSPNLRSISGLYGLFSWSSGLASKYRDTVMAQYQRYEKTGYFGHLREYTPKEVCELLTNFGFELVDQHFMAEHRKENAFVIALEELYPEWRLFAKYLFKKTEE